MRVVINHQNQTLGLDAHPPTLLGTGCTFTGGAWLSAAEERGAGQQGEEEDVEGETARGVLALPSEREQRGRRGRPVRSGWWRRSSAAGFFGAVRPRPLHRGRRF